MSRTLLPILLAASLALAGCVGTDDGDEALEETATDAAENETETPEPTAALSANRTSGPAPLNVSFSLEASAGNASADWTFEPGDGGEAVEGDASNATVDHTYEEAGNYTALLTVEAGNRTADDAVNVTVEPAPETDASGNETGSEDEEDASDEDGDADASDVPDPVVIEGDTLAGHPAHIQICVRMGVDAGYHEIAPAEAGWTYALEPADSFAVYWWNSDGFVANGEDTGTVPDGATHAEICATTGTVMSSYTLTLWHPDDPDAEA